jgi:hypothetical protein
MRPGGFDSVGLKTAGGVVFVSGHQNLWEDLEATRGIIGELASRQSNFMKGFWLSDA